jgi:hypothetical protein
MESLPCRIPVARMPWRRSMARRCSLRYLLLLLLCPFVLGSVRLELKRWPDGGVGVPLWNFSSMGGIIFRTFRRMSLVD